MKKTRILVTVLVLAMLMAVATTAFAGGFDEWGYNYKANIFNGFYDNYSRPAEIATSGDKLVMKWNDAWMDENKVRHDGFPTYTDSGA